MTEPVNPILINIPPSMLVELESVLHHAGLALMGKENAYRIVRIPELIRKVNYESNCNCAR